jgi:ABC-type branched-subunit amino acid transport system ATPase component
LSSSDPDTHATPAIELRSVRKAFGGFVAVDVDQVAVSAGRATALIGPNGAGKTTLFDIVTGFVPPTRGTVLVDGVDVTTRSPQWRAAHGLVRTFQLTRTFERLSVRDNMLVGSMPARRHGLLRSTLAPWVVRREERLARDRADELLERVGLTRVVDLPAGALSGGQRKLLELSRALMGGPRVLMLDEPMAGVNPTIRELMMQHIRELVATGHTVLFVEHDLPRVMQLADDVIVLDRGVVIAQGAPDLITSNPAVIKAYLGGSAA